MNDLVADVTPQDMPDPSSSAGRLVTQGATPHTIDARLVNACADRLVEAWQVFCAVGHVSPAQERPLLLLTALRLAVGAQAPHMQGRTASETIAEMGKHLALLVSHATIQ